MIIAAMKPDVKVIETFGVVRCGPMLAVRLAAEEHGEHRYFALRLGKRGRHGDFLGTMIHVRFPLEAAAALADALDTAAVWAETQPAGPTGPEIEYRKAGGA